MTQPGPIPENTAALPRKLTTIFCADVQGYSALVEADEVGTVNQLKLYRAAMIAEIERHHGRVVNTWGDGLLAEFSSPVEAVFAAVEVQRHIAARNIKLSADAPGRPPMQFRIGINLGDVMVDGNDLYGDGVNIAARLESLAEPGGVCISGTVFEQVRKKLDFGFDFIGTREIKNIAEPIPAYRIMVEGSKPSSHAAAPASDSSPSAKPPLDEAEAIRKWRRMAWRIAILVIFLAVINLITNPFQFWFQWPLIGFGLILAMRYPVGIHPRRMWPLWHHD